MLLSDCNYKAWDTTKIHNNFTTFHKLSYHIILGVTIIYKFSFFLMIHAIKCLNLTRKHNVMHLSFTLMKKVVKFVVSNIVLGINYSYPVFFFFALFIYFFSNYEQPSFITGFGKLVSGKKYKES